MKLHIKSLIIVAVSIVLIGALIGMMFLCSIIVPKMIVGNTPVVPIDSAIEMSEPIEAVTPPVKTGDILCNKQAEVKEPDVTAPLYVKDEAEVKKPDITASAPVEEKAEVKEPESDLPSDTYGAAQDELSQGGEDDTRNVKQSGVYEGVNFSLNNEETGYSVNVANRNLESAIIPESYNGLPVTEIEDSGFAMCMNLNYIYVPKSIIRIGRNAFVNCRNLVSVKGMSNVQEIGDGAFAGCFMLSKSNLILPSTIETIGEHAFKGMGRYVDDEAEVKEPIVATASPVEDKTETEKLPESDLPSDTYGAAQDELLYGDENIKENLNLSPEGVAQSAIDGNAEDKERLDDMSGDEWDDENAYTVDSSISDMNFLLNRDKTGYSVRVKNRRLTQAIIPSYYKGLPVTEICSNAFASCTTLISVIIPNTVTKIGDNAFLGCVNLMSVKGMARVVEIGSAAFSRCEKLFNLNLPNCVQTIGRYAFRQMGVLVDKKNS